MDFNPLDLILHLDVYLDLLVTNYGPWIYAILFLVIFCETGLVVMPFLPGDSLLFIAGAVAAGGGMDPVLLGGLLMLAAILGDSTNYVIGRTAGERLFSNPNSKIFRRDYLQQTHDFYDKHGGKTVTLARFLPIIRTFAPFVAGVGENALPAFLCLQRPRHHPVGRWPGDPRLLLRQRTVHQAKPVAAGRGHHPAVAGADDHRHRPQPLRQRRVQSPIALIHACGPLAPGVASAPWPSTRLPTTCGSGCAIT